MALSTADIRRVANVVTVLLAARGLLCCLVGSAAGYEYGISRVPNVGDVDVLVMTDKQPEELKNYLVSAEPSFYWAKPTTNPQARYHVLWYTLPSPSRQCCRVDLFTPGMIHLPLIPSDKITHSNCKIPLMPFFPILLHKVQAWKAHSISTNPWAHTKQQNDIRDIEDLLAAAMGRDECLSNQTWLEKSFLDEALEGVQDYIGQHPETAHGWAKLGFLSPLP